MLPRFLRIVVPRGASPFVIRAAVRPEGSRGRSSGVDLCHCPSDTANDRSLLCMTDGPLLRSRVACRDWVVGVHTSARLHCQSVLLHSANSYRHWSSCFAGHGLLVGEMAGCGSRRRARKLTNCLSTRCGLVRKHQRRPANPTAPRPFGSLASWRFATNMKD